MDDHKSKSNFVWTFENDYWDPTNIEKMRALGLEPVPLAKLGWTPVQPDSRKRNPTPSEKKFYDWANKPEDLEIDSSIHCDSE